MSDRNVRINLLFQTDTSNAMNNIQQLGNLLNKISTTTTVGIDSGALNQAVNSAQQLSVHLQKAINTNTGKLDLVKLNTSLKQSNQDLQGLTSSLQMIGPTGQQAFIKVATAVSQAEAPMFRINARLKEFGTTLLNTIKWQIASTAIHSVSGMLSDAVSHAEDLNRALNDIRIVTGYSEQTMAKFAERASQAAKELSTTTTEYSKAALIFYQQGLSGEAVSERADVVVKLAQVTGESAQSVSDQMTAIWNNFADGSESLEYYADVLTKLGAATAASTDEISAGLEKFAAVADTVGLSYEYAAASVATVVDKTRQSAEVVGTSFKTIFARMQGLSLGETLEDGVDLNKYSEALAAVGVNVLDASGELRDMDDLLDELGSKWKGFGEETQVAIAQTVGGLRQYNQMIALMDNWDSVKDNIDMAKEATGELTQQQNIWATSYEAAANRVTQAQNQLYEQLLSQDTLIGFNNIIAEIIGGIGNLLDATGGIIPVVGMLIAIFSTKLFPLLQAGILNFKNNLSVLTGKAYQDIANVQSQVSTQMSEMLKSSNAFTEGQRQQMEVTRSLVDAKKQLLLASKHMSAAEREEAESIMQTYEAIGNEVQRTLEKKVVLEEEIRLIKERMNVGTVKKDVVEISALNSFRNNFKGSEDQADAIVDQATSTSIGSTKNEINALNSGSAKVEIEKKIAQLKQENLRIEKEFDQLNSNEVAKGEELLNTLSRQNDQIQELEEQLNHVDDITQERVAHLEEVLSLQQKINDEAKKDSSELVVGSATTSAFEDNKFSRAQEVGSLEEGMTKNIVTEMSGTTDMDGNVTVDASVANLEKLYGLIGQYKMQLEEVKALEMDFSSGFIQQEIAAKDALIQAEQELKVAKEEQIAVDKDSTSNANQKKAAVEKVEKAQEKYNKALSASKKVTEQSKKANLDYTKAITSLEKKMKTLAKSAGASEKDLKDLSKSFQELGKGNSAQAIENIKNKLKDLKIATSDTDNSLDLLAQSMRTALVGSGMDAAQLDALIANLQELNIITPEVANKMRLFNQAGDQLGGSALSRGESLVGKIATLGSVAGQAAMTISMASSALQSLMNPDSTPLEKAVSTLMALSMIIPIVTKAIQFQMAVKKAKLAVDASEGAMTVAHIPQLLVEAGAISVNTAATWGNTIAKLANLLASPYTMAIAAVAIVAIAGVTAWLGKNTEETEKNTQAKIDNAEASNKASDSWQEESSKVDSLIAQYKDLQAAGEDLKAVQEDLANSADDLVEAYTNMATTFSNLSSAEFKDMQGNTITYAEAIDKLRAAMAAGNAEATEFYKNQLDSAITPEAANAAKDGATSAMNATANAMAQDGGAKFKDGMVTRHVGGTGAGEEDAVKILHNAGITDKTGKYGADIQLDASGSDKFLADYEKLLEAKQKMEAELGEDLDNSDTYREVSEMLEASEEEYEKLKEMQAEADKYAVVDVAENLKSQKFSNGESMDITNINSLEEYNAYRDKILADPKIKGDPAAEQAAIDWLNAQSHLTEYEDARLKIVNAADVSGLDTTTLTNEYNKLSEEEKKLFMEVDFNTIDSVDELHQAIDELQDEANKAERVKLATELELDEEEVEAYTQLLMQENKALEATYETAEDFEDAMTKVAIANKRMEKGVKKIADGWEDFDSIMSDSTSTAEDISSILPDVNEGLQDILNISDEEFELLPPDFAQKNWGLIQDVMNGVDGAVDTLRDKAGQEILLNIGAKVDADGDGSVDAAFMEIHNKIAEYDNMEDFQVGVAIDPAKHAEFIASCNELINAAGMTAEQAQAYFASMGYDVELEEVEAPPKETPWHIDNPVLDEAKTKQAGVPIFSGTTTLTGTNTSGGGKALAVKTITPNGSYGGGVGVNTTAPKSATKGKNKGGGGSKPKNTADSRGKKEDIVDRYKEINDELEKTSRLMKKNETLTSKLWGPAKIAQMKNNIKLMEKENQQLEKKYELSKKYLAEDKQGLQKAASDAGVSFTFDESGAIVNYTEEMTKLFQQREALLDSFGATMDENEEKRLEEFDKKVEALKDAYETYETTLDEKQDMEQEHLEKMLAIQEEYFNVLNEELEIKISIDETSLKVLDYYLGKMEDDFFSRAESAALMVGGTVNGQTTLMSDSQLGKYQSQLQSNEDYLAQLEYDHTTINPETGETYINDAQYMEGLETAMDGMIENLNAIQQLDKAMMHYYGDTLAAAGEEIDKVTSRMEHQTEILDHYMTMLDLMNKSNDYKAIGTVLEGKAETTKNEMIAAREEYDMYRKEAEEKYKLWMSATNEEEAELYKKQYEDALAASDEAQSEYLSKAETYAEQLKAILENSLNEYAQSLENALTGGTSFDQLTAKMERAASLQEEYLTTTNKIYETNKLMNQAQQEIDKSTNSVAQRRLKQFINETNQLQQKNKLSQYELEIQQAKYDLLLAEIALEEAQEAKSTVRLQRDSEGNFGYVYTADSSKIAEAEQKLSDAQNSLYNIALEGANGYTEKYQQTLQEMYETLTDLQQQYLSGAFESEEEYHAAVEAAKVYYYEKLEQYSDLHSIAIAADTRVIEDAWSSQFSSMIYNTREWKEKVDEYVDNAADAFRRWNIEMDDLAGDLGLGGDLSNLSTAVGEVTSESDKLLDTLTKPGGVLDSIQAEFDAVTAVTAAYAKEREEISKTVAEYEKLIKAIDTKKQAEGKAEEDTKTDKNQQKSDENKENSSNPDDPSPKLTYGSHVSVKPGTKWYYDSYGTSPTGTARAGTIKYINLNGSHPYNIEGLGWIKKTDIVGYDTGGYTGAWGSYGKLAMLHEKELILNPGDTTNFLASIELLDNIIKTIDLQAANSQLGGLLKSPSFGNLMQQQQALEQNVKIEASFPNVQNRTEIEAAFETLVNRASQYANRK